jgi:hypothetical protein
MKSFRLLSSILIFSALFFMVSCSEDDPIITPLEATTVSNLPADPATSPPTGPPPSCYTCKYTLFSFATGDVVANSDSATSKWDIGFNGTIIIVNSGTSGPGTAGAIVQTGVFDEIVVAPDAGYKVDDKNGSPTHAIPTGSDNGWYHYNAAEFTITPIAGRVLIIKTAEGKYAKMEILNYYKDAPATPNYMTDADRYYTFRYVYQADGSKNISSQE